MISSQSVWSWQHLAFQMNVAVLVVSIICCNGCGYFVGCIGTAFPLSNFLTWWGCLVAWWTVEFEYLLNNVSIIFLSAVSLYFSLLILWKKMAAGCSTNRWSCTERDCCVDVLFANPTASAQTKTHSVNTPSNKSHSLQADRHHPSGLGFIEGKKSKATSLLHERLSSQGRVRLSSNSINFFATGYIYLN